jgi:hypothetical protein
MTERDGDILSEADAARVWSLSARLQAEASGAVETTEVHEDDGGVPDSGYALVHVRSAAQEAGIADEFVDAALADLRAEQALSRVERGHSMARRFLSHPPDTVTVRRVVEAEPEEVLSAMQAVLPSEPFRLTLTDQEGDPLQGGVLIFALPGMKTPFERGFAFEATEGGLRQVFVSLRPIQGQTMSCEMTVRSPVTSHNIGLGLGALVATLTGAVGAGALGAIGVATGIGPVAAVGGGLLGAGLGVKGFRALYRFAVRRAGKALEGLVGAVGVRAKGLWSS